MNLRLKLRKNQSTIPAEKLTADLNSLEILGDSIEKLPSLEHLEECRYLLLVCPELKELPALPPALEILKIKGGHFSFEAQKELPPLKTLSLQGLSNGLTGLNLPLTLETLDLSNNKLEKLPTLLFSLETLSRLSLDHNKLTGLPSELMQMKSLNHLSLDHNPLSEEDKQSLYDAFGIWF